HPSPFFLSLYFFSFPHSPPTGLYTLSLHDALPILGWSPFRKTGLSFHMPSASVKGYTLVTPMGGDASYLLDMDGRIVQRRGVARSEEHTSELQSRENLVCRLLLEKKKKKTIR